MPNSKPLPVESRSEVCGGTPVFQGTRVPVKVLFDYLSRNYSLDQFLRCFPSVTREAVVALFASTERIVQQRFIP